eukprot:764153-Hanusia_phi.AAC.7
MVLVTNSGEEGLEKPFRFPIMVWLKLKRLLKFRLNENLSLDLHRPLARVIRICRIAVRVLGKGRGPVDAVGREQARNRTLVACVGRCADLSNANVLPLTARSRALCAYSSAVLPLVHPRRAVGRAELAARRRGRRHVPQREAKGQACVGRHRTGNYQCQGALNLPPGALGVEPDGVRPLQADGPAGRGRAEGRCQPTGEVS